VLIEGHGAPLNVVIDCANRHDSKLLEETLVTLPIPRPRPVDHGPQNVCLDKGYGYDFVREILTRLEFVGHVRPITQESSAVRCDPGKPPRRWKVERTLSWYNRFRGLLIRWSKKPANHLALLHLASAAITLQLGYASADCLFG
jgi:putative transposase